MSGSILQSRESSASVTGTTIQLAFLSNNTAHNVLWVVAHSDNTGSATHSVADTLVNSYSAALDTLIDADNGNRLSHWSVSDSLAGANTVTITFSVTAQFRAIYISEITGVQNLANDGHNARHQLNPGTATDAVTSNAATNTATAFMIALSNDDSGADNAPAVGTGFSLDKTAWNFLTPGATIEFKSGVAAGSNTATFTAITATDDPNTLMAMFKESVSGVQPVLATSRAGRGPGSGPRMRRLQPQTFPTPGPVDTVTPAPSATPFHIGGGGKQIGMPQRRAIPQQYPDTIPFVQDGSATQTPFRIGRGGGVGTPVRRMFRQLYPDTAAGAAVITGKVGPYNWAGVAAPLSVIIAATVGAYTWTGKTSPLSTEVPAKIGAYAWAGKTSSISTSIRSTPGAYSWLGKTSGVTSTLSIISSVTGNYAWLGKAATVGFGVSIVTDRGTFNLKLKRKKKLKSKKIEYLEEKEYSEPQLANLEHIDALAKALAERGIPINQLLLDYELDFDEEDALIQATKILLQ